MSDHAHEWKSLNRYGVHSKIGKTVSVWYVRCSCGQTGFTRPGSRVVFTWTPDESKWEVS